MNLSNKYSFIKGQLVEISPKLSKHEQIEIGIVSSCASNSIFGDLVAVQTIDKVFFGKPEFFTPYSPEQKSESTSTDFHAGKETNIALLSALNNIKELPLSRNQMLLILSSANMISAAAKFSEYKRLLPQVSLKGVIREFVSRCISNYDTVAPYIEQFYIENDGEIVYIRSYGLQFSYKHVGADEVIYRYATSEKNVEIPWDGVRLQTIAYALYKFASEAYENDYDSTKVNIGLSKLLNPSKPTLPNNEGERLSRRKREKQQKFKLELVRSQYNVGDLITLYTTDNQRYKGVIRQIDEHSVVISNDDGSQFFFEGYIKSMQHFGIEKDPVVNNSKQEEIRNSISLFVKSQIDAENKKYPLADSVLKFLAEKQLGVKVSVSDISNARESLGFASYQERRQNQDTKTNQKQNSNTLSFDGLLQYCDSCSAFWETIRQGFINGNYYFTKANGGFARNAGEAYSFKSYLYTVFVPKVYFARNISNKRKHTVWCNKLRLVDENSKIAHTSVAVELGTIDELRASYYFYFSRASFGACSSISEYLETCGVDVKPLRTHIAKAKQLLSNNSMRLSCKYPGNDIFANKLKRKDKDIIVDFLCQVLSSNVEEPLTPSEIWNAVFEAFNIRFGKGNIGGLIDTSKDMGRNVYNLKVSKMVSVDDPVNEIINLTNKMLEMNNISEDSFLPTNAKITHFNGYVYTVQDEFSCQIYRVSKKIMVGEPSMGHICIVKAPNGNIIAATNFATYGEVISFFRIALQERPYYEFMQTFKLLVRLFEKKEDVSSKIKVNIKKLMDLRGLEKENEYERINFCDLDDGMKHSLVAYVKFILESEGGFEVSNGMIRSQFEEVNNIVIAKGAIQEAKMIVFDANPRLSEAYQQYLLEHSDENN